MNAELTTRDTGEQIAEYFTPGSLAGKLRPVVEALKAGGLTMAQTGSPAQAGVSAGIAAAIPGIGAVAQRAVPLLRQGATTRVVQALGPTKERYEPTFQDFWCEAFGNRCYQTGMVSYCFLEDLPS